MMMMMNMTDWLLTWWRLEVAKCLAATCVECSVA